MEIDSQLSRLLKAQSALVFSQQVFKTLDGAQAYLDRCIHTKWFRKRWPGLASTGITVKPLHLKSNFSSGWEFETVALERGKFERQLFPIVYLPEVTPSLFNGGSDAIEWNEVLLWHLVAHHCSPPGAGEALHGRAYAATLLQLLARFSGKHVARQLRRLFHEHKVHWRPRQKLSEEQKEAKRARAIATGFLPPHAKIGRTE